MIHVMSSPLPYASPGIRRPTVPLEHAGSRQMVLREQSVLLLVLVQDRDAEGGSVVMPGGHLVHTVEPKNRALVPAGQYSQEEDSVVFPYAPGAHRTQYDAPEPPEKDPGVHRLHPSVPEALEYSPGRHASHGVSITSATNTAPSPDPVENAPAAHRSHALAPAAEYSPAPHTPEHALAAVAPQADAYRPG